ncbi:MAG: class I SAM-dependent methyltransferase [Gemmatimonadetes bacterium]|nr:class I SAM-dependent methyltransferase [Gemmatimonadota bacterium]
MTSGGFQDHFSARASGYSSYRPTYPHRLFEWLGERCVAHDTAWDCATGSGQAALGLAHLFRHVIATDASAAQIEHAKHAPNVEYRVAPAERSGLPDGSVDCVTVAQALHWLDRPRFYDEVRRVARPGAVVAVWMYNLMRVDPAVDRVIDRLYHEVVGPWWPGNRALVDGEYRDIDFPFASIEPPPFEMAGDWDLAHLTGYLRTWSAVTRCTAATGRDPVAEVEPELRAAWGEPDRIRAVHWPLFVRVGRR